VNFSSFYQSQALLDASHDNAYPWPEMICILYRNPTGTCASFHLNHAMGSCSNSEGSWANCSMAEV
jgi:hypothetical protein